MSRAVLRAELRPLRWGRFSTLIRPKALAGLAVLTALISALLVMGLTHGTLPVPTSDVRERCFLLTLLAPTRATSCRISVCRAC